MTNKKNIFAKLRGFFKKKKSDSESLGVGSAGNYTPTESQRDLLESELAEAGHNVADFTAGLNTGHSPIASNQHLQLNGERFLAAHLVGFKDTLSGIAFKYYGKASEPYYRLIYEVNQEIIGSNMNLLRAGQTLDIPRPPDELSKN